MCTSQRNSIAGERHSDPAKWSPLIYNFRYYYRMAQAELGKTFWALDRFPFGFAVFGTYKVSQG